MRRRAAGWQRSPGCTLLRRRWLRSRHPREPPRTLAQACPLRHPCLQRIWALHAVMCACASCRGPAAVACMHLVHACSPLECCTAQRFISAALGIGRWTSHTRQHPFIHVACRAELARHDPHLVGRPRRGPRQPGGRNLRRYLQIRPQGRC